jgi:HAD superfamily hydrolase (TIGR01459 family)
MTGSTPHPSPIAGLARIVGGFDLFILDLWGCLHDGVRVYDAALDCVKRLRKSDRRIVIMSNAPRRSELVAARIADMGLTADLYDELAASGEETWQALRAGSISELSGAGRVYPIMAARDANLLDGLALRPVDRPESADFLLAIGVDGPQTTLGDFESVLGRAKDRDLVMVCANPDLLVHRGGVPEICAGAIAARYRELGGRVIWFGKPYPSIYSRVIDRFGMAHDRVLCVGDSLRTDIAGGAAIGAGTLLIGAGIHHDEVMTKEVLAIDRLVALCRRMNIVPDFAMPYLAW